jgi:hypothetical protein
MEAKVALRFGDYWLDAGRRELTRHGEVVAMELQAFDLLIALLRSRDRMMSEPPHRTVGNVSASRRCKRAATSTTRG